MEYKTLKYIRTGFFIIFLLFSISAFALNNEDANIYIEFYNPKIFYFHALDDIKIKVNIINNSLEPIRFKVADDKIFNVDFEARTKTNTILEHSDYYIIERGSENGQIMKYIYFKELMLQPLEEYAFILELEQYIDIKKDGEYYVQAFFYPDLYSHPGSISLNSNILTLFINPSVTEPGSLELIETESGEVYKREVIPPDEVVLETIIARQRHQWERFILYLNIESLILNNPNWRTRYQMASEEERLRMREFEYPNELKRQSLNQVKEGDVIEPILYVPTEPPEIIRTTYDPYKGTVEVLEKFVYQDYTERKLYTYYLERKSDFWLITNYHVENLSNE